MELILQFGIVDNSGKIIGKIEKDFSNDEKKNVEKVIENTITSSIERLLKENSLEIEKIGKIGISAPGTCNDKEIIKATNLNLKNFKIVEILHKSYSNTEIKLNNDAKCAAICEKKFGSLKEYADSMFICLGTGVGGAVFLNGELLKTKKYPGFEIGHVVIKKDGLKCSCGNLGCTEMYCSIRALKEKIAKRKQEEDITGHELLEILENEFESVSDIVEEYISDLSIAFANYINIFEPEAICIGGSFAYYENILLKKLVEKMEKDNITFNKTLPKIVIAKYGNDAGMIGASLLL